MNAKLQALLDRQEQIANQIRAEKAKEQKRERKLETRRKVLVGALMLDMMEKDPEMRADILRRLESFLVRPMDRELFDLETDAGGNGVDEKAHAETNPVQVAGAA